MTKRNSLGRGLSDLLGEEFTEHAPGDVQRIRLSLIEPKADQPRQNFDSEALATLADSIAQNGVLQPILVRPSKQPGFYQIIAGERRWRASKMAGMTDIPAVVVEADELQVAQYALIENLQREDLDAWEEACAYQRLMREFSLRQEDLAARLGRSRSAIANSLRLLDLPDDIAALLREKKLTAGHCRTLLGLREPERMLPLSQKVVSRNLSVRDLEAAVKAANRDYAARLRAEGRHENEAELVHVDYMKELEARATVMCGRRVKIESGKRRKILTVEFQNNDDLSDLLTSLCGGKITLD